MSPIQSKTPFDVMVISNSDKLSAQVCAILERDRATEVAAKPVSGGMALNRIKHSGVDVVVMDIDMPEIEGLDTLPKILKADPEAKIILVAPLSFQSVKRSMKGLMAGAAEFVPMPPITRRKTGGDVTREGQRAFSSEFMSKVKALGRAYRSTTHQQNRVHKAKTTINLRVASSAKPEVLVIGSSTGGPRALLSLFERLPTVIRQPILVVQHMPSAFTSQMAQSITSRSRWTCKEGEDKEEIKEGMVYLAPGKRHMVIEAIGKTRRIRLKDDPPVNYCRPAVDPLFESAAKAYGKHTLALVLTGMGSDGLKGAEKIVAAGGTIVAQDEDTSVVWGMPGAVATAGLCSNVLTLKDIPRRLTDLTTKKK
jgi:two-component system, chemotaxis family, protein-glutamate methylesterase/glutaminase